MKGDINNIESIESINNKINNQPKIINNKINNISNNNNIINYNLINNTNMNNNNNKNINNQNLFNLLVNNNNLGNNMNQNQNISNDNQIMYAQKQKKELITLYFRFSIGKEVYIDVEDSLLFSIVIEELKSKYLWMTKLKIKGYEYNKKPIDFYKTVKENGLKNDSKLDVIE